MRDNASRDLARIRRDIIDRSAALRQRLQRILRKVSEEELLTDDFVTLREGRLVLPVRVAQQRRRAPPARAGITANTRRKPRNKGTAPIA